MKLTIINNVTKKEYQYTVTDIGDSMMFYHFDITLESGMDDGEYKYILTDVVDDETVVLATGVLQVGNYQVPSGSTTTYTKENKDEYIQYNGNI